MFWLKEVTYIGLILLSSYNAFYLSIFSFFFKKISNNFQKSILWVFLEWMRLSIACGSPYGIIGAALSDYPAFIQSASFGGILLISFFIIFINASIAEYFEKKSVKSLIYVLFSLIFMILPYYLKSNDVDINSNDFKGNIKIGVIQPNITPEVKWDFEKENERFNKIINTLKKLPYRKIDLVILPETVFVTDYRFNEKAKKLLNHISDTYSASVLFGSPLDTIEGTYNSSILIDKNNKTLKVYSKIKLVPFGEYIPFENFFPKIKYLIPIPSGFLSGKTYEVFNLKENIFFSSLICFEDTLSCFVRKACQKDIDFLVSITNDGWFKGDFSALSHDRLARFRAIENNIPIIRCANTGVSSIIDRTGKVIIRLEEDRKITNFNGSLFYEMKIYKNKKTIFNVIGYSWIFVLLPLIVLRIIFKVK